MYGQHTLYRFSKKVQNLLICHLLWEGYCITEQTSDLKRVFFVFFFLKEQKKPCLWDLYS